MTLECRNLETELILLCARVTVDSATEERIRAILCKKLHWDMILRLTIAHGVAVLVHRSLVRCGSHKVPPRIQQVLREEVRSNVIRSLCLTGELLKVFRLLQDEGIDAIPFKGPVLALSVYGDVTLRSYGDLDILIREKEFSTVKELLLGRGYRPWRGLTDKEEAAHLASEHAYTWVNVIQKTAIDLHWAFVQKRYSVQIEMEPLWSRLGTVSVAGRALPTLNVEDLLLYLCLHGAKHSWSRLAWICDVAELLRRNQALDLDSILHRSCQMDLERIVLLGLMLARDLLGAPVGERVLCRGLQNRAVLALSGSIQRRLFAGSVSPLSVIEQTALFLRMRERVRNKLPYLLFRFRKHITPNQKDLRMLHLPPVLYFLYYVVRFTRLTGTYVRDTGEFAQARRETDFY